MNNGRLERIMTHYLISAFPRLAVAFPKTSRVSRLDQPTHAIWTDTYSQLTADAERRPGAPTDRRPLRAIKSGLALEAGSVAYTASAGAPGDARRVDFRSRSNSAGSRVAMLALSALVASLPWAKASAECRSPVDVFANPFGKDSAHHRPIGSGAVFADRNHPSTVSLLKNGFNTVNPVTGVFQATSADPLLTVTYAGPPASLGLPVTLRVPRNLTSSAIDGVIYINDVTTGKTHEFYHWKWVDGKPKAATHRELDLRGLGHSRPGGPRVGASASGASVMFGLMRGHEVNTPGYKIEHAMQITLSYKANCAGQPSPKIVWPAASIDGYCKRDPSLCPGNIPYGALLALPPSVNINNLGLSDPGKRLAEALQKYGTYVVDTTRSCPNMRGDQTITAATRATLSADMKKIYPLLRMVLNSDAGQTASGGGTPRAENCAFNSPDR
jgi:hypothetical protein